jgi:hypothetical protein
MNVLKCFLVGIVFIVSSTAQAQSINATWKKDIQNALQEFLGCEESNNGQCTGYTGKVLNMIYQVNDFYSQKSKRYMTTNEIVSFLKSNDQWTDLGKPYDQKTLETAQQYANSKKAVVAVYHNSDGLGHVVVITPGQLLPSGSWGLNVPNAASFFATDRQRSFTEKALSFAFAKNMIKDVTIYGRNY